MIFSLTSEGSFKNIEHFLQKRPAERYMAILRKYGTMGVSALASATPVDSGLTANSWYYEITTNGPSFTINWMNSNRNGETLVAILLQYGHGTGTGGYVQPTDYINPAIQPIFEQMAKDITMEVLNP